MNLALRKVLHNLSALTELGLDISSTRDFGEVTRASLHTLLGTLAIPRGAIARLGRPRHLKVVASKGTVGVLGEKLPLSSDELRTLNARTAAISLELHRNTLAAFVERNREVLGKLRAELAVPLVVRGELLGMIFLSGKFTRKPYDIDDLEIVAAMSRHIAIAFHNHSLLASLKRKADENRRLYREMRQMYQDTIKAFGAAIDLKDTYTSGHSDRVARYAQAVAREMGLAGKDVEYIGVAGYLHDIGKIVVDRSIINNPRPLSDREYTELNRHVTTGYEILSRISHPWKEIAYMTKCHHEKVDGTGYPQGLAGEEIPLGSRIVTLADSFDAMMTDRPYRSRLPIDRALADLRANVDTQFDKSVVLAFCNALLKELTGEARDRVLLPMIGVKFDRQVIAQSLREIIVDLGTTSLFNRAAG